MSQFLNAAIKRLGIILNSRIFLIFELVILFIGIPLLYHFNLLPFRELAGLLIIAIVCSIWLFGFVKVERYRFSLKFGKQFARAVLIRFAYASVILTSIFLLLESHLFLGLILESPFKWALTVLLYPILSVLPQELVYRVFFFRRYRTLFTNQNLFIHVNALAFGFLHIIYSNYPAIFLTYAAGYLLGRTYLQTRSFWAVFLEHTLYGMLIFTIGMGHYFNSTP